MQEAHCRRWYPLRIPGNYAGFKLERSVFADHSSFYAAMTPRIDAIVEYLNQFALDEMPNEARALLYLALSWTEVASAVEIYKQPRVINGIDPRRFVRVKS